MATNPLAAIEELLETMSFVVRVADVATQRSDKHDFTGISQYWTIDELLETVFSALFLPRAINEANLELSSVSRVEEVSNTSTVGLRVVGGDEKGSLESETVKYGRQSHGTLTRE
jgi:hypothetical protein